MRGVGVQRSGVLQAQFAGGEINLAIPFANIGHVELGASVGYSERYGVAGNGMDLVVYPGFYVAPHVGVTFQLF